MEGKIFVAIAFTAIGLTLCPVNTWANKVGQISASSALGENTVIPEASIDPSQGLTISFIRTNEYVQQVRVKRGLVDLQFDSALPSGSEASPGAKVIYVSPKSRNSSIFRMSVVTNDSVNKRRLYQILLKVASTEFFTVEVVPDSVLQDGQPGVSGAPTPDKQQTQAIKK